MDKDNDYIEAFNQEVESFFPELKRNVLRNKFLRDRNFPDSAELFDMFKRHEKAIAFFTKTHEVLERVEVLEKTYKEDIAVDIDMLGLLAEALHRWLICHKHEVLEEQSGAQQAFMGSLKLFDSIYQDTFKDRAFAA